MPSRISQRTPEEFESISPYTLSLLNALVGESQQRQAPAPPPARPRRSRESGPPAKIYLADPNSTELGSIEKAVPEAPSLTKSILQVLNGPGSDSIERLAFEVDPSLNNSYAAVYRQKHRLLPDHVLKRIAIQDDLVASIVNTRAAQVQSFGRRQPDRFSTGFKIEADPSVLDKLDQAQKDDVEKRIDRAERLLLTCGHTDGWKQRDSLTFPQYLGMSCRNAVTVGRLATEVIYVEDGGEKRFHSFRPIDAGTIYKAVPREDATEAVRQEARHLLEQIKNEDFAPERYDQQDYAWVQVIEGRPIQALTEEECRVHSFYPVSDVELDGYPVTPIDTVIAAVTTHINITTHNRLYFQHGRASRGMLVIKSDDVDEGAIAMIKQQFNASINNASNSWRMPVFGLGSEDELSWQAIDTGSRDMEFQYLSDTNCRVIMSAFQISPEELPGYQHLSRGSNNQSLSESNNEYKLEAARDVGIRPLISQFEDFLNASILPLLDPNLAKFCVIKFKGLDAETPEKEITSLQEAMGVHLTYDEVLQKVEKKPVGAKWGGQLPMNPLFLQNIDKYLTVGEVKERYFGIEGASKNPDDAYRRDPFWFQFQQLKQAQQQMDAQMQQAQMQAQQGPQQGQGDPQGGDQPQGDQQDPEQSGQLQQPQGPQQGPSRRPDEPDLSTGVDQALSTLTKGESKLPPSRRRLLELQRRVVQSAVDGMDKDLLELEKQLLEVASKFHRKN